MKGGDDMKSNLNVWAIVGIVAIVGLIAGIVGASITGNVIRSYDYKFAPNQVYTKQEVDNKLNNPLIIYSGSNVHKITSCNQLCVKGCLFGFERQDQMINYLPTATEVSRVDRTIQESLIPCTQNVSIGSYQQEGGQPVDLPLNPNTRYSVITYDLSCLCLN